jgi:hypothetical protein
VRTVSSRCYLVRHASIFPNTTHSLTHPVLRAARGRRASRVVDVSQQNLYFLVQPPHARPATNACSRSRCAAKEASRAHTLTAPTTSHARAIELGRPHRTHHSSPETSPSRKGQHTRYTAVLNPPQLSTSGLDSDGTGGTSPRASLPVASLARHVRAFAGPRLRMRAWLNRRPPCVLPFVVEEPAPMRFHCVGRRCRPGPNTPTAVPQHAEEQLLPLFPCASWIDPCSAARAGRAVST